MADDHDDLEGRIFWEVIRRTRENRGLSQPKLAEMLGIRQPNVSQLESGRSAVSEDTLLRIATAYGVSLRDLLLEGLGAIDPPAMAAKKKTTRRRT